ncbi:hypothetical protein [Paenibacillus flagellatus]|uniref:Xaa-Pro dipeptidyl-peptidase C-terminal domain-containing protein n=1 Tax=Paenibacillus flagellatus TaxID=2211139 RepID=A0A2V5KKX9_9BACL|nr:hypothetical protein [Paenibacillus flagellatus]PYI55510.1 hypothetical protein DLM86_07185 [Paenibacillus flagellatus]
MKKAKAKVMRKTRTIRLSRARIQQDLGNGFLRSVFPSRTIEPGEFLTINLTPAPGRVVVNAGWTISGLNEAYATDSFPSSTTNWVLILHNPTATQRTVIPFLISKTN